MQSHAAPGLNSVRTHRRELHVHVVSDKLGSRCMKQWSCLGLIRVRTPRKQDRGKLRVARHSIPQGTNE
jgi:hypothetical protein